MPVRIPLCILVAIALCAATSVPSGAAERTERKLVVDGVERSYLLSRPAQPGPRPMVVVLHGGGLTARWARREVGVEPMVDRDGLVAVYPDAIEHRWNDGRRSPLADRQWVRGRADDVAFIRALVATLVSEGIADPQRIYVAGPSNGGMMTIRLVCEAADLFAAAAPIIASLPVDLAGSCKPSRPVPLIVMNGTADPLVPYAGGGVGFHHDDGDVLSTEATIARFRQVNGCTGSPKTKRLPDLDPADQSDVSVETWTQCASGAPVVLYRVEGGGHRLPKRERRCQPLIDSLMGVHNHDFDGIEAIWSFFKDKQR